MASDNDNPSDGGEREKKNKIKCQKTCRTIAVVAASVAAAVDTVYHLLSANISLRLFLFSFRATFISVAANNFSNNNCNHSNWMIFFCHVLSICE